jgi:hypothetical protein
MSDTSEAFEGMVLAISAVAVALFAWCILAKCLHCCAPSKPRESDEESALALLPTVVPSADPRRTDGELGLNGAP